ncbi:hypothetical protein R1T99_004309 [Salmonella enterica]|nr:hypothetical protein [Salmonella enterica]
MYIYDLNRNLLYRNSNEINQEAIVDAIVEAGGVDNINIQIDFDYYSHKESIEGIKFIKNIGYDISKFNIYICDPAIGVELIKQGYDMYQLRGNTAENKEPMIARCDISIIKECLNQGLDMSKFNKENHFSFYGENSSRVNEISHFIENFQNTNCIDMDKLELFIDSGVFNSKNASEFDGYVPLYYFCDSRYGGKLSDKLLDKLINVYDKIEIIEDRIFDPDNERAKDFIFKRYIETCEDKQGAIEHVKGLFEKEGLDIAECERTMATIARYDSEAIQEAFTHTAPKTSTRRRM